MFQSLIGILMNCNSFVEKEEEEEEEVSIPNRDFDELQYYSRSCESLL